MVALITGCSTGIGYSASLMLARNGFYTYATMRNIGKSASIKQIANKEALPLEVIQLDISTSYLFQNGSDYYVQRDMVVDWGNKSFAKKSLLGER